MNFLLVKFSKFETLFNSIKKSYLFLGFLTGLLLIQFVPPAPPFSPDLGRASYWQSYETSYFATLRSYENIIAKAIDAKEIPLIIFGDSTIRGTGANGSEVWTRVLETKLQQSNPRIKVINFAQNAGDIMGPFLYHHLQRKFPEAYYIVQWHFSSEVGVRHPFHYWLTSEIALRDGGKNPAVERSFAVVPVWKEELSTNFRIGPSTEQFAFVMAGLNVATNYLDVGNWFRYLLLGYPTITAKRTPIILPLRNAKDMDVPRRSFIPPDDNQVNEMKKIFLGQEKARQIYLEEPFEKHQRYFLEMFPATQRANLFLLTLDFNPFYAPFNDTTKNSQWASNRRELGREMERMPDLRWISLSASQGNFEVNDYIDLGHLTPSGQFKLASAVSNFVLNPPFWLERETG
jgi:hypothetical protein